MFLLIVLANSVFTNLRMQSAGSNSICKEKRRVNDLYVAKSHNKKDLLATEFVIVALKTIVLNTDSS